MRSIRVRGRGVSITVALLLTVGSWSTVQGQDPTGLVHALLPDRVAAEVSPQRTWLQSMEDGWNAGFSAHPTYHVSAGLTAAYELGSGVELSTGARFDHQGQTFALHQEQLGVIGNRLEVDLKYVQVPLMVGYGHPVGEGVTIRLAVGPELGVRWSAWDNLREIVIDEYGIYSPEKRYDRFTLGAASRLGVDVRFTETVWANVGLRTRLSLDNIMRQEPLMAPFFGPRARLMSVGLTTGISVRLP